MREKVRSFAASADTVALFFGEDIFVAVGSILLISGFLDATNGLKLEAQPIALWAIRTAICAFLIHGARMLMLDRQLARWRPMVRCDNAVHLYDRALSRAWHLRLLPPSLPEDRRPRVAERTAAQVTAEQGEIVDGDFMSTH